MKLRNLTPHAITLIDEVGVRHVLDPEPVSARLADPEPTGTFVNVASAARRGRVPVYCGLGEPIGLPEPEDDTLILVASVVVDALPHRNDLAVPCDFERDDRGNIVAARGLRMVGK